MTLPWIELISVHSPAFERGWQHAVPPGPGAFHRHPSLEIVYHLKGQGRTRLEGHPSDPFMAGGVIVYPPGLTHAQDMASGGADVCIHLRLPAEGIGAGTVSPLCLGRLRSQAAVADLLALAQPTPGGGQWAERANTHRALALLYAVLEEAEASEAAPPPPAELLVERAEAALRERLAEPVTVAAIADTLGVSADHLRHVFRHLRPEGMKRRLTRLRLERACALLAATSLPLKAIADQCGFDSDRHLATVFRRELGCTAGEYRRSQTPSGPVK